MVEGYLRGRRVSDGTFVEGYLKGINLPYLDPFGCASAWSQLKKRIYCFYLKQQILRYRFIRPTPLC